MTMRRRCVFLLPLELFCLSGKESPSLAGVGWKQRMLTEPESVPTPSLLSLGGAQAEGDLSFRAGDRIEIVKRTESDQDWWTGRVEGMEGQFPANYTQGA